MTLLPQVRSQLDSAARRQATRPGRTRASGFANASLQLRPRWFPSFGSVVMAFAVVVALGIGAGAITLLGHRHTAAHTAVPRQTTSPSTQLPAPIHGLQGHPIVITVWASWCAPCRSDLSLVASVASRYGPRVAFIAADYKDVQRLARAYLREHHIALPNYPAVHLHPVVPTDLQGVPTTIFVNSAGRVTGIHPEAYRSASALADDVAAYARFGPSTHPSPSGTA